MSIWKERIPVGKKFVSMGRTIGEGDFTLLTNLTWTTSEIHSNGEYMKNTQFGERILAGPCVLACTIGLASTSGLRQVMHSAEGIQTVALLGFENVNFRSAVKPGDTLTVHTEILDVRPSSRNPKRAIMRIRDVAFNQHGDVVCEATRASMLENRT